MTPKLPRSQDKVNAKFTNLESKNIYFQPNFKFLKSILFKNPDNFKQFIRESLIHEYGPELFEEPKKDDDRFTYVQTRDPNDPTPVYEPIFMEYVLLYKTDTLEIR